MSRTLSYAMPKKRQFGGLVGSTPQLSQPLPMGNPIGGVIPPAPQYGIDSQRMINAAGGLEQAKGAIEAAHSTNLGFGNTKPGVGPKANQMSVTKLQYGGDARRSRLPTTDMGGGKRLGLIGGDGAHGRLRYVVTGGLGARPAIPGRIGYRGTLQANNQGGLAAYYASLRDTQQARAARSGIDPVSKLSYLPTDREINAQLEMLGKKYGPYEAQLLRDYHEAVNIGDRDKQDQAEKAIRDRKAEMEKERSAPVVVAPTKTGGQNPAGIPVQQAKDMAINMVGQGTVLKNNPDTESLKKEGGGETASIKPYIVNEKGEEAWQPDGEKPQLIPGKEKMVLFPKDGKVIPHGRTMEMVKKGMVEMPEHRRTGGEGEKSSLPSMLTKQQKDEALKEANIKEIGNRLSVLGYSPSDIYTLKQLAATGRGFPTGRTKGLPFALSSEYGKEYEVDPLDYLAEKHPEQFDLWDLAKGLNTNPRELFQMWGKTPDATGVPMTEEEIAGDIEPDVNQIEVEPKPIIGAQKEPLIPASPLGPAPQITDYLGNALKAGQELTKTPLGPVSQNRPTVAPAPTPEQIKAQQGYTPEEQALLLQGQQMQQRGLSEIGPHGVKFASGGGIENGKAFGPHVVPQPQAPVNIRPGVIKDELGDVGTRLAKQKGRQGIHEALGE